MPKQWVSILISFDDTEKLARKQLLNELAQPLIGVSELKVVSVILKFTKKTEKIGALCSNLQTNYEISPSGALQRKFSPLKIIKLFENARTEKVVEINSDPIQFSEICEAKFWLCEVENSSKRIDVHIDVHVLYRQL